MTHGSQFRQRTPAEIREIAGTELEWGLIQQDLGLTSQAHDTNGRRFEFHVDVVSQRERQRRLKDVSTFFGPTSVQFKRVVAPRVSA